MDLYDRVITPAIKGDHALYLHFTLACILSPHIAVFDYIDNPLVRKLC